MAARAAVAERRSESHEQAGRHERSGGSIEIHAEERRVHDAQAEPSNEEAGDEGHTPGRVTRTRLEESADDTADPRDAAIAEQQ